MIRKMIVPAVLLGFMMSMLITPGELFAKKKKITDPDVVLTVKGMACSYCAFGLEKKLKKLKGVQDIYVDINESLVQLKLDEDARISEADLRTAVTDAGMTLEEINYPGKMKTTEIPHIPSRGLG